MSQGGKKLFSLVNLFWLFFLYIIWLVFTSVLIKEQRRRFVHLKGISSLGTVFFSVVGRNCIAHSFSIRATHPAIPGTLIHRISSPLLYCTVQCSSCRLGTLQILSQPSRKDAHVHQTVRCYHPHPHWTPPPAYSTQHWPQTAPPPCSHLSKSLPALGWSPVSPHLTPQHKGYEGIQLHCSLTLELTTPPPPTHTPVWRFLSLLCQFYPCYTFAVLSFFLFLKYFIFALRPWVSWNAPQLATVVSSLRLKKKKKTFLRIKRSLCSHLRCVICLLLQTLTHNAWHWNKSACVLLVGGQGVTVRKHFQ